ncbi:hypothetical protein [Dysosmobacter sp.]|uniref:hypothetical protein n=1 Tax=Dysosmobacter sp. TaxID=2591382 RepID=UPI003AB62F71
MANSELLSYVKQVMDLETSVYTNQRLEDGWINSLEECGAKLPNKPKKPKKETVPIPPFKPTTPTLDKKPMLTTVIECGFGILLIIIGILLFADGGFSIVGGFGSLLLGIPLKITGAKHPGVVKKIADKYAADMEEYNKEMDAYNKRSAEAEAEWQRQEQIYQSDKEKYDQELGEYGNACYQSMQYIHEAGWMLKDALENLYDVNIIYPKYRNLVAVTTIYEYLASGRCDTLEGADGAYNLYEMELRQNIIIGQLSSVLDSLEQIKNNQFTLYNEIEESNRKSAELLSDIADNTKFSAYANEETAKANAAIAQNTEATKYYTLFNAAKRK